MKHSQEPIALVATACRLPGGNDVTSFWSMVRSGGSGIGTIPDTRFDRRLYYDPIPGKLNKTYTDLAALIDYPLDTPTSWALPPNARNEFDIAHCTFAESVVSLCQSMGLEPSRFPIKNTGVFVGHTRPGTISQDWAYRMTLPETVGYLKKMKSFDGTVHHVDSFLKTLQAQSTIGLSDVPPGARPLYLSSDITRLVSEMLRINGPGMVFNSACASSLHAIAQGVLALRHGRIDAAIVGGSTFFHSDTLLLFASSRSMTKNRSCPFDQDADGLVIGEGNVVFLLKRLSDALVANDPVLAVLTGIGIASDGKGKSLWAPKKEGQIEAIRKAYPDVASLSRIDYIEAHATSTALGDATELEALQTVFGEQLAGRKIPLGSAKGNVGHTLEVAGATGILKAALTLSTGIVPPVGGLKNRNPAIPWETIPFFAPQCEIPLEPTEGGLPRCAAVNSFGIGGLNVHLVLEEFVPEYWREKTLAKKIFPSVIGDQGAKNATAKPMVESFEPIAVVGRGCILPDAYNIAAFDQLLASGKNAFRAIPKKIWDHETFRRDYLGRDFSDAPAFVAGVVDHYQYDWKKNKVPPKQVENASPIQFMMLDAVNEAFAEFGTTDKTVRQRTGVIVGTGFGGDFSNKMNAVLALPRFLVTLKNLLESEGISPEKIDAIIEEYTVTIHRLMPALLDESGSFTPSALASRITKTLDLGGGAVAVESEIGSFGAAIWCAADQLQSDGNDMMVVIGGQQDLGPCVFDLMVSGNHLSQHPELSAFDQDANGIVPGEGCGVLLLKRLSDAQRDGNPIFAVIDGITGAAGPSVFANMKTATERAGGTLPDHLELAMSFPEVNEAILDAAKLLRDSVGNNHPISLGTVGARIGQFGAGSAAASCLKGMLELEKEKTYPEAGLRHLSALIARRAMEIDLDALTGNSSSSVREVGIVTGETNLYFIRLKK